MKKIIAPLCIVGLLSAGILAGCGTANRNFNTNQYNGKYNTYDYNDRVGNGVNDLNNTRFRSYNYNYNDRTNINGMSGTNRTNIYGGSYPTNIYGTGTTGLTGTHTDNYDINNKDYFGTNNRVGMTSR